MKNSSKMSKIDNICIKLERRHFGYKSIETTIIKLYEINYESKKKTNELMNVKEIKSQFGNSGKNSPAV